MKTERETGLEIPTPVVRLRRLRQHRQLRDLITENRLSVKDLVLPLFVKEGIDDKHPISSMPGHFQWPLNQLSEAVAPLLQAGIPGVLLFGIPTFKDESGSSALSTDGVVQRGISILKQYSPDLLIIADLCLCEYTNHGHCGLIVKDSKGDAVIHNDQTLSLLVKQAISLAEAGADVIAPSGMMDGAIAAIRAGLDQAGFSNVVILSYAIKYSSAFYGPFREAAEGAPQFGDRRSHQMNPANAKTALREVIQDIEEAADMLMVKPAHTYLDVIYRVKQRFPEVPLGAYHVSGEYAMIKAAASQGWLDEQAALFESVLAIKRAGADFIISYGAVELAPLLKG